MHSDWEAGLLDVHRLWTVHHWISLHLNSLLELVQAVSGTVFLPTTLSFSFSVFLICQHIATCASFKPLVVGDVLRHFLSDLLMCFTIQGPAEASAHSLPTPTNKEQPQPCFSSWSLSSLHDCTSCRASWAGTSWRICVLWYLRAKQHGSIQNSKKIILRPKNSAFDTCWSYFQSAIIPWSQLWSVYS